MTDWTRILRDTDPGRNAVMPEDERRRMRAAVMASANAVERAPAMRWSRAFLVAATMLIAICATALAGLQRSVRERQVPVKAGVGITAPSPDKATERQQLHFETPGGTRIIWVFDSEFDVKGTLP